MAPDVWRWEDASRTPAPGSILPGDIIGVSSRTSAAKGLRFVQERLGAPAWAHWYTHVGIARDHRRVVDAMPRARGARGDVAEIPLLGGMVEFAERFMVLRWDRGRAGPALARIAASFVGRPYSLTQTMLDNFMNGLPPPLLRYFHTFQDTARESSRAVVCSTLVHEVYLTGLPYPAINPFDGMRHPLPVPLPADIISRPGLEVIPPAWA